MGKESNIDWKKEISTRDLILFALAFFLVAGMVMGFAIGYYGCQKNWKGFFKNYKSHIDEDCICFNKTTGRLDNENIQFS